MAAGRPVGAIVRAELDREPAVDHSPANPPPQLAPTNTRLLAAVADVVTRYHAGRTIPVTFDSDFERDLGLDSLAKAEVLLRVGDVFGVTLPDTALAEARTPRDLAPYLGQTAPITIEAPPPIPLPDTQMAVPDLASTLTEALAWHAARDPERLHVLLYGDGGETQRIGYGALYEAAIAAATGLLARGLQPRQTVALMLPTSQDYLSTFFGVLLAGGIPVPIYPPARLSQVEEHLRRHARILTNAECVFVVTVPQAKSVAALLGSAAPSVREILTPEDLRQPAGLVAHRAAAGDIALLQYTSGSTGDPKGVMLTHANLLANIRAMGDMAQVGPGDVFVSWLPLYHDMGLIGAWLAPLYFGFPLVLMSPLAFLARPARWLQALSRHRGTISAAPNFAYELCAQKVRDEDLHGVDLSAWRFALNGAEPVSASTLEVFARRFAPYGLRRDALVPCYGLAENCVGLSFPPLGRGPRVDRISQNQFAQARRAVAVAAEEGDALEIVSCGRPLAGHALRVVAEAGQELPERQVGRLQFRGPSASAGYYRNPDATARLLAGEWRETGDYAYLAEGEVFLTGRAKDLILRGGRNIYPYDLEQAVGALAGVRRGCVAVFGVPDSASGTERLVVLAETREADTAAREQLRQRISDAALDVLGAPPDEVVLAPPYAVLKTSSGKIRRAACREAYESGTLLSPGRALWWTTLRLALATARARWRAGWNSAKLWITAAHIWAACLLVVPPLWCLIAMARRPKVGRWAFHWGSRAFLGLSGLKWRATGLSRLPQTGHVLLVNHASYVDSIYLSAALPYRAPYRFITKREFLGHWLTRHFSKGIGSLFVERTDPRRSVDEVETMAEALRRGDSLIVFPEGTFDCQTGLRPFRTGAFAAAARAGAPLVTAGLRGTRSVLRDGNWLPRRAPVEIEIGSVLEPAGNDWAGAIQLRDRARAEMLGLCGEPDLLSAAPAAGEGSGRG
jgi:1-acyl-sn-glycerol-3-phosphate acyltransferase